MHHSKILELLHTAHQRFSSIRVKWTYRGNAGILKRMSSIEDEESSSQIVSDENFLNTDVEIWYQTWSHIWWQKPDMLCEESGDKSEEPKSIVVLNQGNASMHFPQNKKTVRNIVPTGASSYFIPTEESAAHNLSAEKYISRYCIIYPSFLLASHDFQFVKLTSHLNRDAILAYAKYRKGVDIGVEESFFWKSADQYEFVIDCERGILLEYSLKKDEQIVAIASVEDIAFDESFPDTLFSI